MTKEQFIFPPGKLIQKSVKLIHVGQLDLFKKYEEPLPTMVEARFDEKKGKIVVRSMIFINSDAKDIKVKISQLFCVSTYRKPMLQMFIHCGKQMIKEIKKKGTGRKYQAFQLEFSTDCLPSAPKGIQLSDIELVQTFLWDIDPKTSRGTVTTVTPAVKT